MATNLNEAGINKPRGKKRKKTKTRNSERKKATTGRRRTKPHPHFLALQLKTKPTQKGLQKGTRKHRESDERRKIESKNPKSREKGKGINYKTKIKYKGQREPLHASSNVEFFLRKINHKQPPPRPKRMKNGNHQKNKAATKKKKHAKELTLASYP